LDDRLTQEEQGRLLEAARSRRHGNGKVYRHAARDELLIWLMLYGGLTPDEACDVRYGDVRCPALEISLQHRTVTLLQVMPWDLFKRANLTGARHRCLGISPDQARRIVRGYALRAGLAREIVPRTLRRTYAHEYFARMRNLPSLARALGLKDVRSAATYLSSDVVGGSVMQYSPEGL